MTEPHGFFYTRKRQLRALKVVGASCSRLAAARDAMELEAPASVIMTIYNPFSANLNATKPEHGGEAERNCVVVRRGGKQLDAKKQSQISMNSIRCVSAASLLVNGEACAKRDLCPLHPLANTEHRVGMYGWSENASKDVYVNGESCLDRPWAQAHTIQQSEPPYELRSLVTRMEQREVGK
jgi:hypothetical protein